ncbi:MAG TPA: hypothetical protein VE079_12160 [Ensifer sp.]|nr:hypothetical protein [Ensifer sp.]
MAESNNTLSDTVQAFLGAKATVEEVLTWIVRAIASFIEEVSKSLPPNFVELLEGKHGELRRKIKLQRKLLRRGILPSDVVIEIEENGGTFTAPKLAHSYAEFLRVQELDDFAATMLNIAKVAKLGLHESTLRVIFPEIERTARRFIYAPGTTFEITSLPSFRAVVGSLILDRTFSETSETLAVDSFLFVLVDAMDVMYFDHEKNPSGFTHKRAFRKVPNRHYVCHGLECGVDEVSVLNALTVLYVVMALSSYIRDNNIEVAKQLHGSNALLKAYKDKRREFNSVTLKLWRLQSDLRQKAVEDRDESPTTAA